MNRRLGAQQRTSSAAAQPAERSTHTQAPLRRAEQSTANHRPAANMLGQPGQSTSHVPYKRQPVYRATHRCVFQPLSQHICGMSLLRSCSGGVSAKALQQLQEIKCFGSHAVKCLCKVYVLAGEFTCMLESVICVLGKRRQLAVLP